MRRIWFLDDSDFEVEAFREVFDGSFVVHTALDAREFHETPSPNLILLDLYFREPHERGSGENLDPTREWSSDAPVRRVLPQATRVKRATDAIRETLRKFDAANEGVDQMAEVADLRQHAEDLLDNVLQELNERPAGGLRVIQAMQAKHHGIPVAFLSRKCQREDVDQCRSAGAIAVLLKPPLSPFGPTKSVRARDGWLAVKNNAIEIFNDLMDGHKSTWLSAATRFRVAP